MNGAPNSSLITAILHELQSKLRDLAEAGRGSTIDLRRLPLTSSDYGQLKGLLGKGELVIEFNALGESRIMETRFSGVWWVTHMNAAGEKVGDFLEIALVPELVAATSLEIAAAAESLSQMLRDIGSTSTPDSADSG